jgi:CelD/BcsL family acetyltransferase involved in cellulose biosynthesis
MYQINVKPISELELNQELYLGLFEKSQTPAFFTHPSYLLSWWKYLGRGENQLITILLKNELVGYVALFRENASNPWRFIGAKDESDYLDLVTTEKDIAAVWQAVLTFFKEHNETYTSVLLESVPENSLTTKVLEEKAPTLGFTVSKTQQDECPVIALPASWEAYETKLEPSLKKRIKRFTQAIQEDDVLSFKALTTSEEIAASMPTFISLHKASGSDKTAFWTPEREAFFLNMPITMAQHGLVKIEVLEVSNDPAAMIFSFIYQNKVLGYNSGFNQYRYGHLGVGTVLAAHSIEEAIKAGHSHYDFMRGREPYKFEFGAISEPVWDIRLT